MYVRVSLNKSLEKPLQEAVKLKPELSWRCWRCQSHGICAKESCYKGVEPAQEREVLQSTKLKGVGDLKNALTSDMEMQSLEFAQLVFSLALV